MFDKNLDAPVVSGLPGYAAYRVTMPDGKSYIVSYWSFINMLSLGYPDEQ